MLDTHGASNISRLDSSPSSPARPAMPAPPVDSAGRPKTLATLSWCSIFIFRSGGCDRRRSVATRSRPGENLASGTNSLPCPTDLPRGGLWHHPDRRDEPRRKSDSSRLLFGGSKDRVLMCPPIPAAERNAPHTGNQSARSEMENGAPCLGHVAPPPEHRRAYARYKNMLARRDPPPTEVALSEPVAKAKLCRFAGEFSAPQ